MMLHNQLQASRLVIKGLLLSEVKRNSGSF